ncbi:WD repeat-containing protein WRAP73 [Colletotrichum sp. SAR 10_75]|nr:WD repeat-containing protein WRAP73 [Colletotrichum sp. SAR 10_75]
MHFSRIFKSSPHCVASPDGTLIATLTTGSISFRSIETLETTHSVRLPSKLGPANAFLWSSSSRRVLVSFAESIHVYSALESGYRAVVRNPASPNFKPTFVQFGASDSEILMCSSFGLKFSVFDLTTSRAVEIGSPKFHQPTSAPRGFALRPGSGHLALLTRVAGKDIVSIHHPTTRGVQRSWHPETVDAQGLTWTPDGRRLIMWESAAQGHKVLFYTADGHLLNTWSGPSAFEPEEKHFDLGAGVKIWQEQIGNAQLGSAHTFVKATQSVSAPGRVSGGSVETKPNRTLAVFDASSTLLATALEDWPSTVWVWDILSSELRAVLVFHGNISALTWHPTQRELLSITCEGDGYDGLVFTWDPLSDGPKTIDFAAQLPDAKLFGKSQVSWLNWAGDSAVLLMGDTKHRLMVSMSESDTYGAPWQDAQRSDLTMTTGKDETQLDPTAFAEFDEDLSNLDMSEVDDTFSFKKI